MTAEDRAAHVEREAVAADRVAAFLDERLKMGGLDADYIIGANYCPLTVSDLRAVLAALPQTGDAADDRLICCPECRSVFEAEDHTIHDGDEMAALARVFALADDWEAAGTVSVYESAGELGQILRAALTAGADQ